MTTAIYESINRVQGELAKIGISKDRRNQQQGYAFRGIDDVYGALAPLLSEYKVCIFPRVLSRVCVERESASRDNAPKKVMFFVVVEVEYDLVSAVDGSKHTVKTYGEAMDLADKATNKAMSAAYKYMCLQTFCIPTEGESPDADETTIEPVKPMPRVQAVPLGMPEMPLPNAPKDVEEELKKCNSREEIGGVLNKYKALYNKDSLSKLGTARRLEIEKQATTDALEQAQEIMTTLQGGENGSVQ